jgi:glycosyltransferase involved in cell wall biosynthesis
MRILLSYSAAQFRPDLPAADQPLWGTSANILARSLHETLSTHGEVTYIDPDDVDNIRGQRFDLFVGIFRRFSEILAACEIDRSVLFAVNMHPAARNALLLDFLARERVPYRALSETDLVPAAEIEAALKRSTWIIGVGNLATQRSYVARGVPPAKIRMISYRTRLTRRSSDVKDGRAGGAETTFLYSASELGLRQGFDMVCTAFDALADVENSWELHLLGTTPNRFYEQRLSKAAAALGERLVVHGWLAASSAEYETLLARTDFVFYPVVEAGQAGGVLDALAEGAIPIISDRAGIDFSPLGSCALTLDPTHNLGLLGRACASGIDQRLRLREQGAEYLKAHHEGFRDSLADAIEGCVSGSLRPERHPRIDRGSDEAIATKQAIDSAARDPLARTERRSLAYVLRWRYLVWRWIWTDRIKRRVLRPLARLSGGESS